MRYYVWTMCLLAAACFGEESSLQGTLELKVEFDECALYPKPLTVTVSHEHMVDIDQSEGETKVFVRDATTQCAINGRGGGVRMGKEPIDLAHRSAVDLLADCLFSYQMGKFRSLSEEELACQLQEAFGEPLQKALLLEFLDRSHMMVDPDELREQIYGVDISGSLKNNHVHLKGKIDLQEEENFHYKYLFEEPADSIDLEVKGDLLINAAEHRSDQNQAHLELKADLHFKAKSGDQEFNFRMHLAFDNDPVQ